MKTSTEEYAPSYSKFAQQELPAWRPIITPVKAMIWLFVLIVISFICGPLLYVSAKNTIEVAARYDDKCQLNELCKIKLQIPEDMDGKIYMKYKLTNYYQNHRRFMESRSRPQLKGEYVDYDGMTTCNPVRSIDDSSAEKDWILPCGLSATTLFNDTFSIPVQGFSEQGIVWESDKKHMFKSLNEKYTTGEKWLDEINESYPGGTTNEHFIAWMRTAAFPTLVKKYAVCHSCHIPKGELELTIMNQYPTSFFKGDKYFILSTESAVGSKNPFLGYLYFAIGGVCTVIEIALLVSYVFFPRKEGDEVLIRKIIDEKAALIDVE